MENNQTGVTEAAAESIEAIPPGEIAAPPAADGSETQVEQPTEQETKEAALIQARDDLADRARKSDETARLALDAARKAEENMAYMQGQMQSQQKPADRFEGRDPDDMVTVAELKSIEAENKQRIVDAQAKTVQQQRLASATESIERAKKAHPDFDEAYAHAQQMFTPGELGAIGQQKDPGELLYQMVLAKNPEMKAKQQADIVKQTVETVNANLNAPGTLSGAGGSDRVLDQVKKYGQMSNEDFEAEIAATKRKG